MPSWVFMKPVGFSQRETQQKVLQAHLWVPLVEPAIFETEWELESVRRRKLDGKLKTCGAVYIGFGCYPVQ